MPVLNVSSVLVERTVKLQGVRFVFAVTSPRPVSRAEHDRRVSMRLHRGMPSAGADMRTGDRTSMMQQGMMGSAAARRGSASKDADLVRSSSRHTKK